MVLDVVIISNSNAPQDLHVMDVGLSDHLLLSWIVNEWPVYKIVSGCHWKVFDFGNFQSE